MGTPGAGEATSAFLHRMRQLEVEQVLKLIPPGSRVLEIGGGDGYQARALANHGCTVRSIDPAPRPGGFFNVEPYDGQSLPFADGAFDYVFSSNVLEHVTNLDALLAEMHRVLKPGGRCIHILPTPAWRLLTTAAHFAVYGSRLFGRLAWRSGLRKQAETLGVGQLLRLLSKPVPHGEYPSALAELYYYSGFRWRRVFARHGFLVAARSTNGVLYSGFTVFPGLPLPLRRLAARLFGATCQIFELHSTR